ncbi:MAG: NUDIX domain-containing protein [Candidatus Eisenbacteria bacterium]|nr:NUDIX domain-containing protein [Candidatus Eisenbacteria bacterium]MCC7142577.1 NUDIX domain-containing protein [Candidatus Eisenbacteria bacterium]
MSRGKPVILQAVALLLVERDDHYVMIQEAKPGPRDTWYFPAGGVEPGESLRDAAVREAREESGLEVEVLGLVRFEQRPLLEACTEEIDVQVWRFFLLARAVGGQLKQFEDEHSIQAGWFHIDQIPALRLRTSEVLPVLEAWRARRDLLPIDQFFFGPR